MTPPTTSAPPRVHLVGAGGAGLSGLARLLLAREHVLTAHDRTASRFTRALEELGVPVALGPSTAELLPADAELVVRSAAVPEADPQVAAARARGLEVVKYAAFAARVLPAERLLAVSGTHGKTTTSWMLFAALRAVAEAVGAPSARPGALVGGWSPELGANAAAPEPGGWVAFEACEYDRSFLNFAPRGAAVTNVEADHLDYFGTLAAVEEAFSRFVDRVHPDGLVVAGSAVPEAVLAAAPCPVWRLGRELRLDLASERRGRARFRLRGPGWRTPEVQLAVPGRFNAENAALAIALAVALAGRDLAAADAAAAAARGVAGYAGCERRFESWGSAGEVELVHDYAHHPSEVTAVVDAARRAFPGRPLHVLFQPHQHSRTARFLADFVESLRGVDRVVVAPVYGARVHIDDRSAGAPELAARLARAGTRAVAPASLAAATESLVAGLSGGEVALILGAGDVDEIRPELTSGLALRGPRERRPVG